MVRTPGQWHPEYQTDECLHDAIERLTQRRGTATGKRVMCGVVETPQFFQHAIDRIQNELDERASGRRSRILMIDEKSDETLRRELIWHRQQVAVLPRDVRGDLRWADSTGQITQIEREMKRRGISEE